MNRSCELTDIAQEIILKNQYMTIGTVNATHKPWVSPVVYAYDKKFNLYFMSLPASQHIQNIKRDPQVSGAIFDSHQLFGEGIGLQFTGKTKLVPIHNYLAVFKHYFERKWPYGNMTNVKDFKTFFRKYRYRFYQVKPLEIWINDPSIEYDSRVKVKLSPVY